MTKAQKTLQIRGQKDLEHQGVGIEIVYINVKSCTRLVSTTWVPNVIRICLKAVYSEPTPSFCPTHK